LHPDGKGDLDEFLAFAASELHRSMESNDWLSLRKQLLTWRENELWGAGRKSPQIPLTGEKGVDSPRESDLPNLGEMQLAREIDDLIEDGRKLSALHRAETLGHHDPELDKLRWSVAMRIDDLLARAATSPMGKRLSVPHSLKNRVHAFDLLVLVRKHL